MDVIKLKQYFLDNPSWYKNIKQSKKIDRIEVLSSLEILTHFLPDDAYVFQRGWHVINDMYAIPTCKHCNGYTNWNSAENTYRIYCCTKCQANSPDIRNKTKLTNIKKYGGVSPANSASIISKMENTNLERYGVKNAMHSDEVKNNLKASILDLYGVDNVSKSDEIKEKKRQTSLKNYGVDHYFKTDQYGEYVNSQEFRNIFSADGYQDEKQARFNEKYGSATPLQVEHIKQKVEKTNITRYGVSRKSLIRFSKDTLLKLRNKKWLIQKHHIEKLPMYKICEELENYDPSSLSDRFKLYGIEIKYFYKSYPERVISELLSSYNVKNTSSRSHIHPYELDLFIPEHNIAIEYCGLYWHNELSKVSDYHKMKYELCKAKGIRLLTIFEDEWIHNQTLVEQKILYLLNFNTSKKLFARKCEIRTVTSDDKKTFYRNNHIQGDGPSSINYGLYYNSELVAVIGFIKQKDHYILNRYATSCSVVGGFTKLLTHFEREYDNPKIVTFADLRWSGGELYEKSGFVLDKVLKPDYSYVIGNKRHHKFNFRHTKLKKILKNYNSSLSEHQNMLNNKIYRIYDCGKLKYIKN